MSDPVPKTKPPRAKPPKKPPAERIPPKAAEKILPFAEEEESESDDDEGDLKSGVRRALKLLEDGKAVAAYNLLKRLV